YIRHVDPEHPLKAIDNFANFSLKRSHYVSCWSCGDKETYPMWKVYSNYRTALAIRTTVGDLIESIKEEEKSVYIGAIKYVDPNGHYIFTGSVYQFLFE